MTFQMNFQQSLLSVFYADKSSPIKVSQSNAKISKLCGKSYIDIL